MLEIPSDCKSAIGEPQAGGDNVEHGYGKQHAPSKVHQLVVTKTRQCPAHPDVEAQEKEDFENEPEEGERSVDKGVLKGAEEITEGAGPATEEEQCGDTADCDHVA